MTIRTDALLLRMVDFGESDRIVHLLTPSSGRVSAIAKGARRSRKRFPGTLDWLNRLHVQLEPRPRGALWRLEHAALRGVFARARRDPARFALACYLLELLDRLAPEGAPPADAARLFRFAERALELVDASEPDARLRVLLELRTLDALGLRPELARCVRCGRALGDLAPAGFHVPDGGPLCTACARPADALLPVSRGTLRALEGALALPLERVGRLALGRVGLGEARQLMGRFHRFHLGIELKSEAVLDALLKA